MPFSLLESAFCPPKVYSRFLPKILDLSHSVFHLVTIINADFLPLHFLTTSFCLILDECVTAH